MQHLSNRHRWLIAAWLMLWGCMSSAFAVPAKDASWSQWATKNAATAAPEYQFRTTSIYISETSTSTATFTPLADKPSYSPSSPNRARKDLWDSEPTDDPIGVVPVVPIGEPLILLVLAILYLCLRQLRLTNGNPTMKAKFEETTKKEP